MLVEVVNRVVAPESLAIAKKLKINEEEKEFASQIASSLLPGDIILVKIIQTQTPMSPSYEVLRSMACSYFDHVAVLLEDKTCLQIGPPKVQEMPAYYFLVMSRKPLVLRLKPSSRQAFLNNLTRMIGKHYNYLKAVNTWISLFFLEKLKIPLKVKNDDSESPICSDGILASHPEIEHLLRKYSSSLDYSKIGAFSINDFLFLAEKQEFEVIKLPYPFSGISSSEDQKYLFKAKRLLQQESIFSSIVNASNLIQTGRLLGSIKKKKYRKAYRLVFILAQLMKVARIRGVEAFHILSFFWPRL
jgi:hypothetical protein